MQHALDARACNYMMPDVMKIGGVTGWMQTAALADVHQIRLSNHLWPEISAQLLCATPTALRGVTGTGVEWNESAVSRYAAY